MKVRVMYRLYGLENGECRVLGTFLVVKTLRLCMVEGRRLWFGVWEEEMSWE
jgi:hypothetical protein